MRHAVRYDRRNLDPCHLRFVDMTAAPAALLAVAHAARTAAPAGDTHPALYETCAALIVAVMVVLYFDERVRRGMNARTRGYAVGFLGCLIGTGLLIPLFALADFMPDTVRLREITVGYTLIFFVAAFGAAIQIWGTEEANRIRASQQAATATPPATVLPLTMPPPRPAQTEREHAAQVLAAAMTILGQIHPDTVTMCLAKAGPAREAQRLGQLNAQWMTIQPALIALTAGYPSAEVRAKTATFIEAAAKAVERPAILFANPKAPPDGNPPAEWQEQAKAAYAAAHDAWNAVADTLHAGDDLPGLKPGVNGKRPRRPRPAAEPGKTTSPQR
jgi:hypothetical protein